MAAIPSLCQNLNCSSQSCTALYGEPVHDNDSGLGRNSGVPTASIPAVAPIPRVNNEFAVHDDSYDNVSDMTFEFFNAFEDKSSSLYQTYLWRWKTLSKSGSQSACPFRFRTVNVKGQSSGWHEFGIAPFITTQASYYDSKLGFERAKLLQRFLFVALRDALVASRSGFVYGGRLVYIRINAIVSDQKQERSFLSLKSVGSFKDCSICEMPTRICSGQAPNDVSSEVAADNDDSTSIYQVQCANQNARSRHVVQTVQYQIFCAASKLPIESHGALATAGSKLFAFSTMRHYLTRFSAIQFPPALAASYGFGTALFHLYQSAAFDRLHVIDLGVERDIPDMAYKLFRSPEYNKGELRKSVLVRTANQRFADLPRWCGFNVAPFRSGPDERHANMIGKLRRQLTPFLWVAFMGLQPRTRPDNDMILQAALGVNEVQIQFRGINLPSRACKRTENDIIQLESLCFKTGLYISKSLAIPVNTKLHRLMRHVGLHIRQFGCLRRGETDANETRHKTTKQCYTSTNKRFDQLSKQIITIRSIAEIPLQQYLSNDDFGVDNSGLVPSYDTSLHEKIEMEHQSNDNDQLSQPIVVGHDNGLSDLLISQLEQNLVLPNIGNAKVIALSITSPSLHTRIWFALQSTRLSVSLPCAIYTRRSTRKGILEMILEGKTVIGSTVRVAVVRRLQPIEPQEGNRKVVEDFGHLRYAYAFHSIPDTDVVLDCVSTTQLSHMIPILPDMYDITVRHSVSHRMFQSPDSKEERRNIRFFVAGISNVNYPGTVLLSIQGTERYPSYIVPGTGRKKSLSNCTGRKFKLCAAT
eukprot:IDg23381t1